MKNKERTQTGRYFFRYTVDGVRTLIPQVQYVWCNEDRDAARRLVKAILKEKWPAAKVNILD